jgi:hypothetical protein
LLHLRLTQLDDTTGGPTTQASSHHKQVHPTLRVQPSHWVTQSAHRKPELLPQSMALNDKPRGLPLLCGTIKATGGNTHIGRTFMITGKPKRH